VFKVLAIALLELQLRGDAAALAALKTPYTAMEPAGTNRAATYHAAVTALRDCLEAAPADAGAVPPRDAKNVDENVKRWILDVKDTSARGNACYMLGRFCELRKKPEDAKFWYRTALETHDWNFTFRPAAAVGLRRLGEEFYK
jgi:hypothetical protein